MSGAGLAMLAVLALGCGGSPRSVETVNQAALREAKGRWLANGPRCYEITEEQGIPPLGKPLPLGPWTVTVCDNEVVNAVNDDGVIDVDSRLYIEGATVKSLFAKIDRLVALDPLESYVSVEYDPSLGFPRKIECVERNSFDAWWQCEVRRVVPIDCAECERRSSTVWTARVAQRN